MTRRLIEAPLSEIAHEIDGFIAQRTVQNLVVHVRRSLLHHARLGANQISSCGTEHGLMARLTVFHDRRSATVSTSTLTPEGLRAALMRATQIAATSPENPEFMPPYESWDNPLVGLVDAATAQGEVILPQLEAALIRAREHAVLLSGFLQSGLEEDVVCSSVAMAVTYRESSASLSLTARTQDGTGSGKARWSGDRISKLNAASIADEAITLALASQNRKALPVDSYPTILAPAAAADLLGLLVSKMLRRPAEEGRSAFSRPSGATALGETLLSPALNIRSDPGCQELLSRPFTLQGEPIRATDWVSSGVVTSLQADRFWAGKSSAPFIAAPSNLVVPGSSSSLSEVIARTERALLVHHLWYIRMVDEQSLTVTGLTRDGVFLVENGMVVGAVNNLRFNDSPLRIFSGPITLGSSIRSESNEIEDLRMQCPSIGVSAIRYTASSDAV